MIKPKALIVDDEPLAHDVVQVMLKNFPQIEVIGTATNGKDAVQLIDHHQPDLVFLDIQMPDLDGFGVLKNIQHIPTAIVFTTAYDQYALKAFEVNAIDYLLKPFDEARFQQALQHTFAFLKGKQQSHLQERLESLLADYMRLQKQSAALDTSNTSLHKPPYITRVWVKIKQKLVLLQVQNIDWVEATGDYVTLHTGHQKHLLNESMQSLEQKLDPQHFLRIHRSTLINLNRIKELQPHFNGEFYITLHDNTRLKSSRSYREQLKIILGNHW